jgi:hypothetical protein
MAGFDMARWYNRTVRRFVFAIIVGLLTLSASGVSTIVAGEPCTGFELTGQGEDDGACPPTCVTCGCCAQAAEPVGIAISSSPDVLVSHLITLLPRIPRTDPLDILHVPKLRLA